MLEKISNNIAFSFVRNNIIESEDVEVYSFGILAFLEIAINILSTLILAIIFDCILETIAFVLIYIPLRSTAGGYHAKKYISCYILSIVIYLSAMFISFFLPLNAYIFVELFSILFTSTVVILLAPIDCENNRATKSEKKKYRKASLFIICLYSAIIALFVILSIESQFIISLSLGGVFCSIFLLMAIKERRKSNEE